MAGRRRSSTARASASVVGSATVGPEPMVAGSSPGTSEMASVSIGAARGLAQAAALDARDVAAHRVHLVDVGAALEEAARQAGLGGERRGRPPAPPTAPRRRPTAAPARDRAAVAVGHKRERRARPRWTLASSGVGCRAETISMTLGRDAGKRLRRAVRGRGEAGDAVEAPRARGSAPPPPPPWRRPPCRRRRRSSRPRSGGGGRWARQADVGMRRGDGRVVERQQRACALVLSASSPRWS